MRERGVNAGERGGKRGEKKKDVRRGREDEQKMWKRKEER